MTNLGHQEFSSFDTWS